jgi:hypothetical protein
MVWILNVPPSLKKDHVLRAWSPPDSAIERWWNLQEVRPSWRCALEGMLRT